MAKQETGNATREAISESGARGDTAREDGARERAASPEIGAPPPVHLVRGFAALLLVLGATALMNGSIFPQFDAVFMFARDISVTCSAATLLALGLLAYRAPAVLYLARLSSHQAAVAIAVAYTLQLAVSPACALIPPSLGVALFLAFPLAALALTATGGGFFFDAVRGRPSPSDMSVTRPASFLAPFSALFGCLFLFQVAFGFALRFDEVAGTPRMSLFSAAPLALVVLYVALSRRRFPADGVVQLSALVVMAGFLLSAQPLLAVGGEAADVALLNMMWHRFFGRQRLGYLKWSGML